MTTTSRAVACALLLLAAPALATAGVGSGPSFSNPRTAQVVTVGKSGADNTVICGADCTSLTSTCAAGSAIASITDASITKPYVVDIGPGVYNECVVLDEITDIHLKGAGIDKTIIRPTVTDAADVNGGVVRIGPDADADSGVGETARITVSGMTIHNDAFSAPESAIQIGEESGPGAGVGAAWQDVVIYDVKTIGAHDSVQWNGSWLTTDGNLPRLTYFDSIAIGGADTIVRKGFGQIDISNVLAYAKTNYCESTNTTKLDAVTGTQQTSAECLGLGNCIVLAAGEASTAEHFYAGRRVVIGGGGGCADNGEQWWVLGFDPAGTDGPTLTLGGAAGGIASPDPNCTYAIDAVPNAHVASATITGGGPACTDLDWSIIRGSIGSGSGGGFWKTTAYHNGVMAGSGTAPTSDYVRMRHSRLLVEVNDFGTSGTAASCGGASAGCTGGIMLLAGSMYGGFCESCSVEVSVNVDLPDAITAADPIVGVGIADAGSSFSIVDSFRFSGSVVMNNSGDADENVVAIKQRRTGTIYISQALADLNMTVGGYAGTALHLKQETAGSLNVASLTSPDVITTSGTIGGWSERCFTFPDFVAGTDDQPIPVSDALVGLQVAYVGCRCLGTCGGAEDLTFEDDAGNQIGSGAVACVDNTADMTWTDVRTDGDALIPASKSPRFDTTTASGTATDDLQVCLRYTTGNWIP